MPDPINRTASNGCCLMGDTVTTKCHTTCHITCHMRNIPRDLLL